jgi:CzcA family heavy metal efflux pump
MRALISLCARHFGAVCALTLLLVMIGVYVARRAPLDVFPEFVPAQVEIQTECPGFAPQQVEELVTRRLETALSGTAGIDTLRSNSIPGLSAITVNFYDGIDVHLARQSIAERLAEIAATLPPGVAVPKLSPLVSSTMDLLKIGLLSDRVDPYTLRDIADWTIRPRLLAVPGVARVIVFGGDVRQVQINPDTARLLSYGVTLNELADGARAALALKGTGFIDTSAQRILINSPTPEPRLDELRRAVIANHGGVPIRIGDVASVAQGSGLKSGDALIMGRPGVMLSLASQYGANTLTVTRALEAALAGLTPALKAQGIIVYPAMHRPANFIEQSLGDLQRALFLAAAFILVVLYLFLRNARAAFIAFTAIPLSLLAAILVLYGLGETLNTMTLGGLAVGLGVLVDDAIIDIENILRRMRLNAAAGAPLPRLRVIRDASLEVRTPVIFATLVAIMAFVPQLFTPGVQGHFIRPLALAFIFAVTASLLVASTVTVSLCALLLRDSVEEKHAAWLDFMRRGQVRCVRFCVRHFPAVALALVIAVAAAFAAVPFLGGTFMPEFREGHYVLQIGTDVPGTSREEMLRLGERISADVLKLPYVLSIEQQVGRAELGEDTWGLHQTEFHVELRKGIPIDERKAQSDLRAILKAYSGLETEVVTFLGDRISESLTGETAQVSLKLFGDDLDDLDRSGTQIAHALQTVDGVTELQFKQSSATPTMTLQMDTGKLAALGLTAQSVLDTIATAYAGTIVGQSYVGVRTIDTVVIFAQDLRRRPEDLQNLMIAGPAGPVPLKQVCKVRFTSDRYSITHEAGRRFVSIDFNTQGRPLNAVVADAAGRVAGIALPTGFYTAFSGAAQAATATQQQLMLYGALAVGAILIVLLVAFRWRANGWLVLVNLPFSLIGSILAIQASGVGLTLGSAVGLVTVFGISARNAILQLAHYEHLVDREQAAWNLETVLRGANERLVPIFMTAAVTALALAPLAFNLHRPGEEIEGPMAITVLGGLLSSTLLNLLVLPALAERFARPPSAARESETAWD